MFEGRGSCFKTECRVLGVSCWACLEVADGRIARVACFVLRVARVGRVGIRFLLYLSSFSLESRVQRVACCACWCQVRVVFGVPC